MTHTEFLESYSKGTLRVHIDRSAAARFVSGRLLLPFVLLPVLGVAVAAALIGHLWSGVSIFLAALALRFLVRSSSPGFVLSRALQDASFYDEMRSRQILRVTILDG